MQHDRDRLAFFLNHRDNLLRYAGTIVGDPIQAEDVVQEAFLRFGASSDGRLLERPAQFLYRIVRNLAIDGRRRQNRDRVHLGTADDAAIDQVPEGRPSPEDHVVAKSELRVVEAALAELPERTRIALEMHRFGGMTYKEIAARLGISVGLAHSLVVDAIEHCRERLQRSR